MSNSQAMEKEEMDIAENIEMDDLVALCKRRGFIFPASDIYGGINGFWDYGPLGTALKNNLRDQWWKDMVLAPPIGPDGKPLQIVGLDSSIIQNPEAWVGSGHVEGFNDPMIDCKETKKRYRADHLVALVQEGKNIPIFFEDALDEKATLKKLKKTVGTDDVSQFEVIPFPDLPEDKYELCIAPDTNTVGTLTEPRNFNLMFKTYIGATATEDDVAYLRPETAQGIFLNFKNICTSSRVRVPFGIAQIGKAFRNEVTPRNFIFRSREFEQMEMEFFCPPEEAKKWVDFWTETRHAWWKEQGISEDNMILRPHEQDELSHYAKEGEGTVDIEYRFPFTYPGFGELEGIAHRCDYDLNAHQKHSGTKLEYFDDVEQKHYIPHVIEPAAGLTRGVLALLAEAYTPDPERPSGVYMKFKPSLAPVKAAVLPLVNKDGLPEIAEKLYLELRTKFVTEFDVKQNIGKRYARHDEIGTPFCVTIDTETLDDNAVTIRHRDTMEQERIPLDKVASYIQERL